MRTTISLDDQIHEAIRAKAFQERRSFSAVANALLGSALGIASDTPTARRLGRYQGRIWIADDFDKTPDAFLEALDEPLA